MEKIYFVKDSDKQIVDYFETRKAAIAFIIDEFSMALAFRNDNEGNRLAEYLNTHDETPNQYLFKYYIDSSFVNHDYDE